MRHSHILNHCEWALVRLNGIVRAKPRGRTTDQDIDSAIVYALKTGATREQIRLAIESKHRLKF